MSSLPSVVLTFLGLLVALLGLFAAGSIGVTAVGMLGVLAAGLIRPQPSRDAR